MRQTFCLVWGLALLTSPLLAQALPVTNGGFEQPGGWELLKFASADGALATDATLACTGQQSLKLTKTNAPGYLVLRSLEPVTVQPKVRYRCRVRYHAENASLANVLLLRVAPQDGALGYNAIDRSAGWMSQSLLRNSPAGQWEKRVGHYQAEQTQAVYLQVLLWGNPCTVWLDDFEVTAEPYQITGAKTDFQDSTTADALPGLLAARHDDTARVVVRDGRSVLLVNDQPVAPVVYKAEPYHTEGDYRRFGEAGVKLATVSVRLGDNKSAPGLWKGRGQYDFAPAEAALKKALLRNPNAQVILDLNFYPYPAWGREHPQECWTDHEGKRAYGSWGNVDGFTDDLSQVKQDRFDAWYYPSYQSRLWQEEAGSAAAALIAHLRQTSYAKAIVGYYLTGGHDGQFQVPYYDYSAATQEAFRQWLQRKYGTIEKLRAAWGEGPESFAAVTVPPPLQKSGNLEAAKPYLTRGPDLDYRDFATGQSWLLRDIFAKIAKEAAGKPVLTLAYGNPAVYDFWPLFGLKYLDAASSMSYYPYRDPGYALGYKPYDSFALHGKLCFQELDTRSWVGSVHGDEVYQMWIGAGLTPQTWRAVNRKLAGAGLAGRTGFWYYDMNHFFDAPEIMTEIGKTAALAQRLSRRTAPRFRPEVCVVETSGHDRYLSSDFVSLKSSAFYQLMALEQSGVPYDRHYLPDVLARPELQQYKLYVFWQTRFLTDAERAQIRTKLQRGGKTIVWIQDPGYLGERGKSVAALSDLIGITARTEERYGRLTAVLDPAASLPGVRPVLSLNEMLMMIMTPTGPSSFAAREQPFWIEDDQATALARYAETGQVAAARKKLPGWTSIYLAAPSSLTGDLLNALARQAGAYVCGPAGQSVNLSGEFVSLHGLHSGDYPLRVPPGVKQVLDFDTQKILPLREGVCKLAVRAQETYWLELQ